MTPVKTSIMARGEVEREPLQRYGSGTEVLRLGNGGAGHTGLLEALATAYLSARRDNASISWIHNHSRNTQLALLSGDIDLALTYERDQENIAQSEGWSQTVGCVFHDHFVLIGPSSDPLGLRHLDSVEQALKLLAKAGKVGEDGALWHARIDGSATMWKERSLWESVGLTPWTGSTVSVSGATKSNTTSSSYWYQTSLYGPADALIAADTASAYALTDRSTLLRQTALRTVKDVTVLFEPVGEQDVLLNTCYALRQVKSRSSEVEVEMSRFLDYLTGDRGQQDIAEFGKSEAGVSFFAPAKDGCAKTRLRGGRPLNGRWIPNESSHVSVTRPATKPADDEDNGPVYTDCLRMTTGDLAYTGHSDLANESNRPHFATYHENFQGTLGKDFKITSVLKERASTTPFFHEACVYIPSEDSVFVTSNQYQTGQSSKDTGNKTISISKLLRDSSTNTWTREDVPTTVTMGNGGVNYDGEVLFCQQGGLTPDSPPCALVQMSTTSPYTTKTLLSTYHGRPFNSINDVVIHPSTGTIWFTDPSYGHAQGIRPPPQLPNQVYVFDPKTGLVRALADGFDMPNGLAFSPDAEIMYVTDTGRIRGDGTMDDTRPSTIYAFDVHTDARSGAMSLRNRRLFAFADVGAPDGIKCDTAGNVFAGCGDGVQVWDSAGVLLGKIVIPGGVANFCFGRKGELFLCGETTFWVVDIGSDVEGALLAGLGVRF